MKILKKQITQKEIAKSALIKPDFLSHIIRGRRRCPPSVALRLEEATGIDKDTWVWGEPKDIRQAVDNFIYSEPDDHGH